MSGAAAQHRPATATRRQRTTLDDALVVERADIAHHVDDSDALAAIVHELLAVIAASRGEDCRPGVFDSPLCFDTRRWVERLRQIAAEERCLLRTIARTGRSRADIAEAAAYVAALPKHGARAATLTEVAPAAAGKPVGAP